MDRTILHCDCNAFYASVECVKRPELKTVPMAVGGNEKNRHGIILAKNELAKQYQIRTTDTIWQAKRKCPELVIVEPHHDEYRRYSGMVNEIYKRYTDLIEPFGIDESWLDVTASRRLFGDGKIIADRLRTEVKKELGLTISVGVSFNKIFAKLGSDYQKPDATTVIGRENYQDIVYPLPVSDLLYVGKATLDKLYCMNIKTIGELADAKKQDIAAQLGKNGEQLWEYANGLDETPVRSIYEKKEIKSVGNSMTFGSSLLGEQQIRHGVNRLSDSIAERMRRQGVKCATVQVVIRDDNFRDISRQAPMKTPTYLSREIREAAMEIVKKSWNMSRSVRMLSVTGLHLVAADAVYEQVDLLEDTANRKKYDRLENTLDRLKHTFGDDIISMGINKDGEK